MQRRTTVPARRDVDVRNERSTTGGFVCPLSRSLPAIPAARGRERNIKRTVIDYSFLEVLRRNLLLEFCGRFILLIAFGVFMASSALAAPTESAEQRDEVVQSFLTSHCATCHIGGDAQGGFDLESLPMPSLAATDAWAPVLEQVQLGNMPPEDQPTLDQKVRDQFVSAIQDRLHQFDQTSRTAVHAFLTQHCLKCHTGPDNRANLQLDDLGGASLTADDRWGTVLEQLELSHMPPDGEPRPERKAVEQFVATVRSGLSSVGKQEADILQLPGFGNYVDHARLFDSNSDAVPASPARLWRVNTDIYKAVLDRFDPPRKQVDSIEELHAPGWKRNHNDVWYGSALPSRTPEHAFEDNAVVHGFDPATTKMLINGVMLRTEGRRRKLAREYFDGEEADLDALVHDLYRAVHLRSPRAIEAKPLVELAEKVYRNLDAESAVSAVASAIMLTPDAVFRREIGQGEPDEHGRVMLSPQELAFAISYSLTGQGPDEPLVEAVASGGLDTRAEVRDHVQRIVDDFDRTKLRTLRFFREYFEYTKVLDKFKDTTWLVYDADLFVLDAVRKDRDVLKRLLSTHELVTEFQRPDNGRYQRHYQKTYGFAEDLDWEANDPPPLPEDQRAGILTHPAWLRSYSTADGENQTIQRGKFVRLKLLGGTVPDVPITVDAKLPDDPDMTMRERMKVTREEYCWGCHRRMDNLGLPFEQYDAMGQFRTQELKKPVDASGLIDIGVPEVDGPVNDPIEMMHHLAESTHVRQVFIRHAFRFWLGRNEMPDDAPTLVAADRAYVDSGGSLKAMLTALLTSDSFLYRRSVSADAPSIATASADLSTDPTSTAGAAP